MVFGRKKETKTDNKPVDRRKVERAINLVKDTIDENVNVTQIVTTSTEGTERLILNMDNLSAILYAFFSECAKHAFQKYHGFSEEEAKEVVDGINDPGTIAIRTGNPNVVDYQIVMIISGVWLQKDVQVIDGFPSSDDVSDKDISVIRELFKDLIVDDSSSIQAIETAEEMLVEGCCKLGKGLMERIQNMFDSDSGSALDSNLATSNGAEYSETNDVLQVNDSGNTEKYFFDTEEEFIIYSQKFAKSDNVVWLSGDDYINKFKEGYDLVEQNKPDKAIEVLSEALRLNPIAISARFELCEAYIKLKQYSKAEETLLNMKDMLTSFAQIAKFYRRLGFIQTDNYKNYVAAAACYLYSTKFEQNQLVLQELAYITNLGGKKVIKKDPVKVLKKNKIPIIEA